MSDSPSFWFLVLVVNIHVTVALFAYATWPRDAMLVSVTLTMATVAVIGLARSWRPPHECCVCNVVP